VYVYTERTVTLGMLFRWSPALRSVPQEWDKQFNRTQAGKGKLTLSTAVTPGDVYAELQKMAELQKQGDKQQAGLLTEKQEKAGPFM